MRSLKDPRINRCKRHLLLDIVTMALCAVVGGADTWKNIALFARRRHDRFARFLALPSDIPSHHTFRRVFDRRDPLALQRALVQWLHRTGETLGLRPQRCPEPGGVGGVAGDRQVLPQTDGWGEDELRGALRARQNRGRICGKT